MADPRVGNIASTAAPGGLTYIDYPPGGSVARLETRNTRWKCDNKKNFKNHIISSIIASKASYT